MARNGAAADEETVEINGHIMILAHSIEAFCGTVEGDGACAMIVGLSEYGRIWQDVFTYFLGGDEPRIKDEESVKQVLTPRTTCKDCSHIFSESAIMGLAQQGKEDSILRMLPALEACPQCHASEVLYSLRF